MKERWNDEIEIFGLPSILFHPGGAKKLDNVRYGVNLPIVVTAERPESAPKKAPVEPAVCALDGIQTTPAQLNSTTALSTIELSSRLAFHQNRSPNTKN